MRLVNITGGLVLLCACSGNGVSTTARATGEWETETSAATTTSASEATGTTTTAGSPTSESGADSTTMSATSDPSSTTDPTDSDTMPPPVTIVGAWLSEGDNLAPILVELVGAESIDAVFTDDTFTVTTLDDQGAMTVQAGVYTSSPSGVGEIFEITLEQTSPSAVTVEGIYEIDNSVQPPTMRYEVVQTIPDVGAAPPTAEGGFGSTANGSDLTQVYVRQ
jgi:hypothetical protein